MKNNIVTTNHAKHEQELCDKGFNPVARKVGKVLGRPVMKTTYRTAQEDSKVKRAALMVGGALTFNANGWLERGWNGFREKKSIYLGGKGKKFEAKDSEIEGGKTKQSVIDKCGYDPRNSESIRKFAAANIHRFTEHYGKLVFIDKAHGRMIIIPGIDPQMAKQADCWVFYDEKSGKPLTDGHKLQIVVRDFCAAYEDIESGKETLAIELTRNQITKELKKKHKGDKIKLDKLLASSLDENSEIFKKYKNLALKSMKYVVIDSQREKVKVYGSDSVGKVSLSSFRTGTILPGISKDTLSNIKNNHAMKPPTDAGDKPFKHLAKAEYNRPIAEEADEVEEVPLNRAEKKGPKVAPLKVEVLEEEEIEELEEEEVSSTMNDLDETALLSAAFFSRKII